MKTYRNPSDHYWKNNRDLISLPENEFDLWPQGKVLERKGKSYEKISGRYFDTLPKTKKEFEKMFSEAIEYVKRSAVPRFWKYALHRELLKEYILPEEMGDILDFGCGAGNDGMFYANMGFNVTFADVAGCGLEFIRWRLGRRGITGCKVINSDKAYGTYDFVMAIDCFEHIMNADQYFKRIDKHLKKGGLLYYTFSSTSEGMDCFTVDRFNETIAPILDKKYKELEKRLYRKIG
jgi:cyclopropane fatty-acyl-phospholipid synthase-like methyltransferase